MDLLMKKLIIAKDIDKYKLIKFKYYKNKKIDLGLNDFLNTGSLKDFNKIKLSS